VKVYVPKTKEPSTPDGKKRCRNCDQPFALKKAVCPHCKKEYTVPLTDIDSTLLEEFGVEDWTTFESDVKRLRSKTNPQSRTDLVDLLFKRAMTVRYAQPRRSLDLFQEVVALDSCHWEARIKVSWLLIRFNDLLSVVPIVQPIIGSESTATVEQRQRAYNNIVCSHMFRSPMDYFAAEKMAREGIALDTNGNAKLWENLGSSLKFQGRSLEAKDAFHKALAIDPSSDFAVHNLRDLGHETKFLKKNRRKETANKENVENTKKSKLFLSSSFKKQKIVDRI
jgi:tetratricopeptide (TPR) repeat protein